MSRKAPAAPKLRGVAWDTTGHALVLAASCSGRTAEVRSSGLAYHSEKLFVSLDALSKKIRLDLSQLDFVAAGKGPGSFTGTRVGVTAAKTLAYATGAKLILLSTLEIVAANLRGEKRRVCVVQDARRSRLFTATYQDGKAVRAPGLVHTGDFLFQLEAGTLYTGDAVMMFADAIARKFGRGAVVRDKRLWHPNPGRLFALARERWEEKRFDDPLRAVPEYLYEDTCNVTAPNPAKRQPR
jgi:tRNA threonylcarbamoyladenosine biosynthesis protein TsaB